MKKRPPRIILVLTLPEARDVRKALASMYMYPEPPVAARLRTLIRKRRRG